MKKLVSLALCAALLAALLAGCGQAADSPGTASPEASAEASPEASAETVSLDWAAARAAYDLDATVLTVDGSPRQLGRVLLLVLLLLRPVFQLFRRGRGL